MAWIRLNEPLASSRYITPHTRCPSDNRSTTVAGDFFRRDDKVWALRKRVCSVSMPIGWASERIIRTRRGLPAEADFISKFCAPLNKLLDLLRRLFHQNPNGFLAAQACTILERLMEMQRDIFVSTENLHRAASRIARREFQGFTFCQNQG